MTEPTIAMRIRDMYADFSPTEKKVVRILLQQYPLAGLETIAQIAQKAHVSGPTVLRFVTKLGFENFIVFQNTLRLELEAQLQSPLMRRDPSQYPPTQDFAKQDFLSSYAHNTLKLINETVENMLVEDFNTVVAWLARPQYRLWLIGGYITGSLAEYFCHHLQSIRAEVALLRPMPHTWADILVDMSKQDVLVIFDIRRYWTELIPLAKLAVKQKTKIVLITDQWTSPLAAYAHVTLTAQTEGKSGWDTNIAVMLLIDALIAAVNNADWAMTEKRLEKIEQLRNQLHPIEN